MHFLQCLRTENQRQRRKNGRDKAPKLSNSKGAQAAAEQIQPHQHQAQSNDLETRAALAEENQQDQRGPNGAAGPKKRHMGRHGKGQGFVAAQIA